MIMNTVGEKDTLKVEYCVAGQKNSLVEEQEESEEAEDLTSRIEGTRSSSSSEGSSNSLVELEESEESEEEMTQLSRRPRPRVTPLPRYNPRYKF